VKGCVDVFLWLETDQGTVYKRELEPLFLKESEAFYKNEASELLNECECPEYLLRVSASILNHHQLLLTLWQVESRYQSEDSRIHHYLSPQTAPAITQILESTLLTPNLATVISMPNSGLDTMIDTHKLGDLARLYRLYLPVPNGRQCLKKALRESILRRGKELNESSLGPAVGEGDVEDGQEEDSSKRKAKAKARIPNTNALPAIKWVQDVLDLKDGFDSVWKEAFQSDREIEGAINEVNLPPHFSCAQP
jgi:cullin 3